MIYFLLYCFSFFSFLIAEGTLVDGVVAVVGDYSVLHSEVLQQTQLVALNKNIDPNKNPYLFEEIYLKTLNSLVDQYSILSVAEKDTNIFIDDFMVDRALDERIDDFIKQAGSKENFEKMMGSSLRQIKTEYWKEIRNMMFIEKYKYSKIQFINVSRPEVEIFYSIYSDSLPIFPEFYNFSVIEYPFEYGEASTQKTYNFLDSLKLIIKNNNDSFESLAKLHSEDPGSSKQGGFLGFTKRGFLVSPYEEAAYSLNIGEISNPILSKFGFHLIKLLDRKGEKISTQHILKTPSFSSFDIKKTRDSLKHIYNLVNNDPFVFDSVAVDFSNKHKNYSGIYNNIIPEEIPFYIKNSLDTLSLYKCSKLIKSKTSLSVVFLYKHELPFSQTLENSWNTIYEYALQEKQNKHFNNIIKKAKEKTYIKIFSY